MARDGKGRGNGLTGGPPWTHLRFVARPSNTEERRAQIVEGLLSVMAEDGYERASIAAIARAADLAPGLLHYHFEKKQQILVALVERLARDLERRVETRLERAGDDPRKRLFALVDAFVALDEDADPRAVSAWVVIGAEAVRQPEVRELYAAALRRSLDTTRDVVTAALRAEEKSTRNATRIAAAILAAIEGSYQIAAAAPGLLPVGYAAPMLRRMVAGMLAAEEER
jgi:TetR/AcrR family transcriptional regulator, transcriptional repressor of bet genes